MPGIAGCLHVGQTKNISSNMIQKMAYADQYRVETTQFGNYGVGSAVLEQTQNGIYEDDSMIFGFYGELFEVRNYKELSGFPLQMPQQVAMYINKFGVDVIKEFNGSFVLSLYNKTDGSLLLANDRMSVHRLYYYCDKSLFGYASEAKAFYAIDDLELEPDYTGIAELLTFKHIFGQRTLWKDLNILPKGSILYYCNGNIKIEQYWDIRQYCNRKKVKSEEEYVTELYELLDKAVAIRTPKNSVSMGLSGGYDARTILGFLENKVENIHSFTYGPQGCGDVVCAQMLSNAYCIPNQYVAFSAYDLEKYAKEVVWRTDGVACPDMFFHIIMAKLKKEKAGVEVSSVAGDVLTGKWNALTFPLLFGERKINTKNSRAAVFKKIYDSMLLGKISLGDKSVFSQEFSDCYEIKVKRDIYKAIDSDCNAQGLTDILFQYSLLQATIRHTLPIMCGIGETELLVRLPFLDYNLIDYFSRLPTNLWAGQKVYLQMISKYLQKSADVPHYVTGKPISSHDHLRYIYLKAKDYFLRSFKIKQKNIFSSDTYDFKRDLLVEDAKDYVMGVICKKSPITTTIFGDIKRKELEKIRLRAIAGEEKAMRKYTAMFTASMLADVFFLK